ncbi:MAG: DUF493 domain-containing protein [Thiocapsa sp.]|nr:DUF493 domain-containing protein [Thiocapsa sp.]MCG6895618.1 DUF493 domain-containing protein [Thiocapsa sp.]MCG6985681.1 DUF493 domain-containing protein [Thiocapsa sp.]
MLQPPCRFPIKAMGRAAPGFESLVVAIVSRHVARPAETSVRTRYSRGGKWVSVTLTLDVETRQQLDAVYRDLSAHELVVWVI